MEDEDIDLTDIPEVPNWTGAVRGKFFGKRDASKDGREKTNKINGSQARYPKSEREND